MPDTIDKATPADSDLASAGAAQFRALKTAIENRMAIPDAVAMSTFFPFVTTVTDTYTQLIQDGIIICNKGTAFNLTVLAAANCSGRVFRVKNIGAGVVTLVGTIGGVVDPTLTTGQMIEWFSDGTTLYLSDWLVSLATTATKLTDGTNLIRTKIIDIGDWNMDLSEVATVVHGLTLSKIRSIAVFIRKDASDTPLYPLNFSSTASATNGYFAVSGDNIYLKRFDAQFFDSVDYDATSYNRGWITTTYVD